MSDDEFKAVAAKIHDGLQWRVGELAYIEAALREVHERGVQEEREMKSDPMIVDHERWLDERNAGAESLALAILGDDGRGLMSPGPCADLETAWRRLKRERDAAYLAGMERAAVKISNRYGDGNYFAAEIRVEAKGGKP